MQKIAFIIALLVASLLNGQNNYEKGMNKAFDLWENNQVNEASNLFERILEAEPDNWLPAYYAAYINVVTSFNLNDQAVLAAKLNKAQLLINQGNSLSPDNPELMVIQALLHTAWISFDGATYGMTLSGKVSSIYAKALTISPYNPRVVLGKAEWDMGSAKYFGKDIKPFCKDVERSLELFANFKAESDFHPDWGRERAEKILENCE